VNHTWPTLGSAPHANDLPQNFSLAHAQPDGACTTNSVEIDSILDYEFLPILRHVEYGFICDVCREGVTCSDKDNLCDACKKLIAGRIVQVENEARKATAQVPGWLKRAATR